MWRGEWDVRWFSELGSTNTYLREEARSGAPEGLVVVADHQTAGRGRLDRRWESPPGANLLASILLRPGCRADDLHLCTAAVALAGAEACREVAGVAAQLKWPNDLVVGESKLAGVLAEAEFSDGRPVAVVVGIGLNVAWPGPDGAGGTCLDLLRGDAAPVEREQVLAALLDALRPRRALLDDAAGRRALAAELRRRCATVGQEVRVVLAGEEFRGLATDLDDAGRLVVQTVGGSRRLAAGDVVHLRRWAAEPGEAVG